MHDHQQLSGTISVRSLVAEWQAEQHTTPQLLLDISGYRLNIQSSADVWYRAQSAQFLLNNPLLTPLPTVSVSVTFPEFPEAPLQHALTLLTKLSYGISIASFLFFMGPILILESERYWRTLQTSIGDSRIYSSETPHPTITQKRSPEPYAANPWDVFSLRVPDLDIQSTIVPNVDSTSKESYTSALQLGIAHAAGSTFPDQLEENKTTYLFAHSTDASWNVSRYNAQFYALKDAEIGQKVVVRYWNMDYTYRIQEKKIISADDTSYMAPQTEKEQLILQTCYPPGTTWKRLLIIAVPEKDFTSEETYNNTIQDIDNESAAQYNTQTV